MGPRGSDNDGAMAMLEKTLKESRGIGAGRRGRGGKKKTGIGAGGAGGIRASTRAYSVEGSVAASPSAVSSAAPERAGRVERASSSSPPAAVSPSLIPLPAPPGRPGSNVVAGGGSDRGEVASEENACGRGDSASSPPSDPAAEEEAESPTDCVERDEDSSSLSFFREFGHVALDKAIREDSRGAVDRSARIAAATAGAVALGDFFPLPTHPSAPVDPAATAAAATTASASSFASAESSAEASNCESAAALEDPLRSAGATARDAARLMASHLAYGLASASCREGLRAGLESHLRGMRTMFSERGGDDCGCGSCDGSDRGSPVCVGKLGPQCHIACDGFDLNGADRAKGENESGSCESDDELSSSSEEDCESELYTNSLLDQGCDVIGSAAAEEAARRVDASFRWGGAGVLQQQHDDHDRRRRMESIDESLDETVISGSAALNASLDAGPSDENTSCGGGAGGDSKPCGPRGRADSIWSVTIGCAPGYDEGELWGAADAQNCSPGSDASSVDGASTAVTTATTSSGESFSLSATFSATTGGFHCGASSFRASAATAAVTCEHLRVYEDFAKLPVRSRGSPLPSPEPTCGDANVSCSGLVGDPTSPLPGDIEAMADSYFDEIYSSERGPHVVVQTLHRFLRSPSPSSPGSALGSKSDAAGPAERDVAASLLCRLLEEYQFVHRYPERELQIAATAYGLLIREGVVQGAALGWFLRCVLHARSSSDDRAVRFGASALELFSDRLDEWPKIRAHIATLQQLRGGTIQSGPVVKGIVAESAANGITSTVKSV